jgi:hypothetical protein
MSANQLAGLNERESDEKYWFEVIACFGKKDSPSEAAEFLACALESKNPMTESVRRVFAEMIRGAWEPEAPHEKQWALRVARRHESKSRANALDRFSIAMDIGEIVSNGKSVAAACREIAERSGPSRGPRDMEMIYNEYKEFCQKLTAASDIE